VAQAAATAALSDYGFLDMCRSANEAGRKQLVEGMEALGYPTIGGQANFVLSKVGAGGVFFKALQKRGIIVRPLAPYGMAEFVRITIGTVAENERLLEAAREIAQNMGVSV
jgi:histidinol-phosphate aminotransferase